METGPNSRFLRTATVPNNFFGSRINGNVVMLSNARRMAAGPTTSSEVELMETGWSPALFLSGHHPNNFFGSRINGNVYRCHLHEVRRYHPNNFFGSRINGNIVTVSSLPTCSICPTTSSEVELMETRGMDKETLKAMCPTTSSEVELMETLGIG